MVGRNSKQKIAVQMFLWSYVRLRMFYRIGHLIFDVGCHWGLNFVDKLQGASANAQWIFQIVKLGVAVAEFKNKYAQIII